MKGEGCCSNGADDDGSFNLLADIPRQTGCRRHVRGAGGPSHQARWVVAVEDEGSYVSDCFHWDLLRGCQQM
jgi:hypothetical protein